MNLQLLLISLVYGIATPSSQQLIANLKSKGKNCPVAVLLHPSYIRAFGKATQQENVQAAKDEMKAVMQGVNSNFMKNLQIGTPLLDIRVVDSDKDGTTQINQDSSDIDDLLKRFADGVRDGQGVFDGLKPWLGKGACAVLMQTQLDFGSRLGSAYGQYNGKVDAGTCDTNGYNTGVLSAQLKGVKRSMGDLIETATHELGHQFGAGHDSAGKCSPQDAPYIMNYMIKGGPNQNTFSECSMWSMVTRLNQGGADCFKAVPTAPSQPTQSTVGTAPSKPVVSPAPSKPLVDNQAFAKINQSQFQQLNSSQVKF